MHDQDNSGQLTQYMQVMQQTMQSKFPENLTGVGGGGGGGGNKHVWTFHKKNLHITDDSRPLDM